MEIFFPEIETVTLNNLRYYVVDGESATFPSITSVLSATPDPEKAASLQAWKDRVGHEEAQKISSAAMTRGTAMHDLAEIYLLKQDRISTLATPAEIGLFNTLKPFIKNRIGKVLGCEVALFSAELEIAGRCDAIAYWDGKLSILDFKTMSKAKKKTDISDYWIQTCFYALAFQEMFGVEIENLVILGAVVDSLPVIYEEPIYPWIEPLFNRREQYSKLVP